jgi:hypothetical protein
MNARHTLGLLIVAVLALSALGNDAVGQQKTLKEQLIGTWTSVSVVETTADGSKIDRWGPHATGILMLDANGHYALLISRSDLPKFASGRSDKGTAEENKAVMASLVGGFGTFTVNETDKILITRVEGNVFPNLVGTEQKRDIAYLTGDEFKYVNRSSSTGTTTEVSWKRVR